MTKLLIARGAGFIGNEVDVTILWLPGLIIWITGSAVNNKLIFLEQGIRRILDSRMDFSK